jgi:uncharacterized protein
MRKNLRRLLALALLLGLQTASPLLLAQDAAPLAVRDKASPAAQPFALEDVRLLDGPFRQAQLRDAQYLLQLDADRLLHTFRVNAGLPSTAKPLGGWEAPQVELRGHTLGHYLSACALMYASTGDERFKTRSDRIVAELTKIQQAMPARGYHEGYLSAFPEEFFDRVDARKPVWAPYYTLHKIMAGLLDAYRLCGNRQALDVLLKLTGWVKFRVDRLSDEQQQRALDTEFGGMNDVLANLYGVTGDPEHLRLARKFEHAAVFDPLARGEDRLTGLHANTQIPKAIGAAREYELTGEARYHDIASFFWQRVAEHRSYVIGGNSDDEHFFPIEHFSKHLGESSAETCNTYNMLKLTRHLFAWSPSAEMMDFYERGLFNHILASQDPATAMMTYYVPLKPATFKTFSTPDDSFWCCVGTGMENHAKYGDTIYFHDEQSLYVNLFIASELKWKARGLTVRQETQFPESAVTRLTLGCEKPVRLVLKIRYPAWARSGMKLTVNGKPETVAARPGSYVRLEREWRDGDAIEIRLPMSLRIEAMPDDPKTVALLYGPIVLAGDLGTTRMANVKRYGPSAPEETAAGTPDAPALICDVDHLLAKVKPVAGVPLTFKTQGIGQPADVALRPFYQITNHRYSVYWKLYSLAEWRKVNREKAAVLAHNREIERRTVDAVRVGEAQDETAHGFKGDHTDTGTLGTRRWRDARRSGWFRYELKTAGEQPIILRCTYWGNDGGNRVFDILVDGQRVATQKLEYDKPGEFFDVEYPIPEALTHGKQRVTVIFQAREGALAGGVFDVRIVRAEKQKSQR